MQCMAFQKIFFGRVSPLGLNMERYTYMKMDRKIMITIYSQIKEYQYLLNIITKPILWSLLSLLLSLSIQGVCTYVHAQRKLRSNWSKWWAWIPGLCSYQPPRKEGWGQKCHMNHCKNGPVVHFCCDCWVLEHSMYIPEVQHRANYWEDPIPIVRRKYVSKKTEESQQSNISPREFLSLWWFGEVWGIFPGYVGKIIETNPMLFLYIQPPGSNMKTGNPAYHSPTSLVRHQGGNLGFLMFGLMVGLSLLKY